MPYRQRRAPRRRRTNRRRPITYGQIGSKLYRDVLRLKSLINVEYKTFQITFPTAPNTTPTVTNLTAISQGDDVGNRDGDKIRSKYLAVAGNVLLHASATESAVRIMLVRDNNGSTTQPSVSDLFFNITQFVNNQLKNGQPQANSRFSILYDKYIVVNSNVPRRGFSWSSSLDHHIYFTGSSSTDEGKGHIYLFISSSEATNDPIVTATSMVKWIDN